MMKKNWNCFATLVLSISAVAILFSSQLRAQSYGGGQQQIQLANVKEDIRVLDERTRLLTAQVEDLTRENQRLRDRLEMAEKVTNSQAGSFVTLSQMNQAIADLAAGLRESDRETVIKVTKQMEALANQTQKALNSLAKSASVRSANSAPPIKFTDNYPKTGVTYTVQSGDTLSSIATKHNSTTKDIQNANKISDPKQLQVGQILFLPQR
jgi:LysM repeat protein